MIVPSEQDDEVSLASIQARIFMVRGVQVMLDRDLAIFYKVETGQLNRQVKRNIGRFPEDFMFQLTKEEWESLKCQIGISNTRGGDRRALPYVFTEQGVSQLSGVLHSELAEAVNGWVQVSNSQKMPRQARKESGTGIFHVMMRGIRSAFGCLLP